MHDDEVYIDERLVRQLLREQFPQWAGLSLSSVKSSGTDNALYRLGEDMCVRLPRIPGPSDHSAKEHNWLPKLAPLLPLAIPVPLAKGKPCKNYPWEWAIFRWLEGNDACVEPIADLDQAAIDLAQFLKALQRIDSIGGPLSRRGVSLKVQDNETRSAIELLHGVFDTEKVISAWEECLRASEWDKPPVWVHGDLLPTNLLVQQGRLSAVIDFGILGIGDPACDLIVAWSVLDGDSRETFRTALGVDEATWIRGQGWALSIALIILPYYLNSNPGLVAIAKRMTNEILADKTAEEQFGKKLNKNEG